MKLAMTGGKSFSLSTLKMGINVLYFYPRDQTPGCTREGIEFALSHDEFRALGATIFGISADPLASHEKFKAKHSFPFELISDPDWELCHKFGVIKVKSLYGRKYEGIERSTFVLGRGEKILREWRGLRVKDHVAEVLEFLRSRK